jgi:DNA-binding winged helix-turn-helix (wHTH) protein/dipeptidyl aminopeptidase/acylaminoacyl peptidase
VYEFDPDFMELQKHGVRIHLQEQPFRVLASLVERPGEIVTREQLKERIWAKDTFVDFDQSLNKAVNRLREALNDDAGQPRYIETVPRRGYRFVAPVSGTAPATTPPAAPLGVQHRGASRNSSFATAVIAMVGLFLVAFSAVVALWKSKQPAQFSPIRITIDGTSMQPALSRDGKLLAYMSAVDGGKGHIWVRQTSGGVARQVTRGVGESEPSFSPDGRSIAFRSEVDGGGVYLAPTFGGKARLVAKGAFRPRFSPDGERISCLDAEFRGIVVPTRGGAAAIVTERLDLIYSVFAHQTVPLWGPNGNQILYLDHSNAPMETGTSQWRIASPAEGESRALNFQDWDGHWERLPFAHAWTQMSDGRQWIVYSASTGDSRNLFRVPIFPNSGVLGKAEQLTSGPGLILHAVLARNGNLAFTSASLNEQIYAMPITDIVEEGAGLNSRLARPDGLREYSPTISRDGRWLAYAASNLRADQTTIRLRDLVNGSDRLLVEHVDPFTSDFLSISPDGSSVLFAQFLKLTTSCSISVIGAAGGLPQKVSDEEADVAGEGLRVVSHGVADAARD